MKEDDRIRCIYCGEELENQQEKSEHIAEEHTDREEPIPRKARNAGKKKSIVDDWEEED